MKNVYIVLFTLGFLIWITGCKKDSSEDIIKNNNKDTTQQGGCDTSFVPGFAGKVKPIIDRYCIGCHSASGASGGVNLSTNASAKASANKILPAINHDPSLPMSKRMPPAGGKLDSCDILIIKRWTEQDFPE